MAMLLRIVLILPMMAIMGALPVRAEPCRARVEHVGNVVQGNRVYSHWLIGHTPLRWATVSFRYRFTYLGDDNKEATAEGSFRQLIRGVEEEYVELKNLRAHPAFVTKTKIIDLSCAP